MKKGLVRLQYSRHKIPRGFAGIQDCFWSIEGVECVHQSPYKKIRTPGRSVRIVGYDERMRSILIRVKANKFTQRLLVRVNPESISRVKDALPDICKDFGLRALYDE